MTLRPAIPCHVMSALHMDRPRRIYYIYMATPQAPPCAYTLPPHHNKFLSQNFCRPSIAGSAISSILPCRVNENGARR